MGEAAFLATQWGLETEGKGWRVRGHPGATTPQLSVPTPRPYLQQVAVAIGPRAEAQEPFSRAQWGGADRLGEMGEMWDGKASSLQSRGKGFRFKSCCCHLLAMRLGSDYFISLGLSFFICGLRLYHPHPGLPGEEVRGQEAWAILGTRHTGSGRMACFSSALSKTDPCHHPGLGTEGHRAPCILAVPGDLCSVWEAPHLVKVALLEASLQAAGEVGSG